MNSQKIRFAVRLLAAGVSGVAQAALQGRDLNGSAGSFEAYYDTVLDITWLADANYAQTSGYDADGLMNWATANTWAANLSFYNPATNQTYADWRLPTVDPVASTTASPTTAAPMPASTSANPVLPSQAAPAAKWPTCFTTTSAIQLSTPRLARSAAATFLFPATPASITSAPSATFSPTCIGRLRNTRRLQAARGTQHGQRRPAR